MYFPQAVIALPIPPKQPKLFVQPGIATDVYWSDRSLKAKFKYADKAGVKYVAVIGDSEEAEGRISLRRMDGGEQLSVTTEQAIKLMKK